LTASNAAWSAYSSWNLSGGSPSGRSSVASRGKATRSPAAWTEAAKPNWYERSTSHVNTLDSATATKIDAARAPHVGLAQRRRNLQSINVNGCRFDHHRHNDFNGDVRFGSKADICRAQAHVRFWPKSGHCSDWINPD